MHISAKNNGPIIVMNLEGQLDFESTISFQKTCQNILKKDPNQKFILNLKDLRFVGSTGINHFIQVLKEFTNTVKTAHLCQVSSEFNRMFKAHETTKEKFKIFDNFETALASFDTHQEDTDPQINN